MDSIYSLSLLLSLIAGGTGAAMFILVAALPARAQKSSLNPALLALGCGLAAVLFGATSLLVHLVFGHGPGTAEPMTIEQFFEHHKAYWLVLVLTVLAFSAWRFTGGEDRESSA